MNQKTFKAGIPQACLKCECWNLKDECCEFDGICEKCVDPKIIDREYEYMEH